MKIVLKGGEPRGLSSSETERLVKEMSQAPERQKEGTFEENSRRMAEALKANTLDACRANAEDPLHAAFTAKAVVHSGPGGMPLMGSDAERTLDGLLDTPRKGKTLAYLHVPFCETRCLYCLFYQNPYKEEAVSRYAEALVKEIQLWSDRAAVTSHPVHAVYFGGGTPTAFSPDDLKLVIGAVKNAYPGLDLMVHFHDTRGLGMANTLAAMDMGVTKVQAALGGLGGCPFAPGASGNLSTEDVVWTLNEMGCDTGISFSKLLAAAKAQMQAIPGTYSGHHIHVEKETPCKPER